MKEHTSFQHRDILKKIAFDVMRDKGLWPEFSSEVFSEVERIRTKIVSSTNNLVNLCHLPWCSIDNDDSQDLDQLTVAELQPDGGIKLWVAIADVASLVKAYNPIDSHANHNVTSVYTPAKVFSMLPEELSTDMTSLGKGEERVAIVFEFIVNDIGLIITSNVYSALAKNKAKLAYHAVAKWLDNPSVEYDSIASIPGLSDSLLSQNKAAIALLDNRNKRGALQFENNKTYPVFDGDSLIRLEHDPYNAAKGLISELMITVNGIAARYLHDKNLPSIRRIVKTPKRWERIVSLASEYGFQLSVNPDPIALSSFLSFCKTTKSERYADISLSVIKLLGPGEYCVETPNSTNFGHFGLAVRDYSHATAPNRRYPDLITQRLLKSAIDNQPLPYTIDELESIASHCTRTEDIAKKVERQLDKSSAALLLETQVGKRFEAIVTGAADKGTWVRLYSMPIEGRLVAGFHDLEVGHKLTVVLDSVDIERGFIDFVAANR